MKYGLYAAIVDAFDPLLIEIARGRRPDVVNLVYSLMDGEKPDMASLTPEQVQHYKTFRVLSGQSLYSHAWLEE
jgi:hypothetical protein